MFLMSSVMPIIQWFKISEINPPEFTARPEDYPKWDASRGYTVLARYVFIKEDLFEKWFAEKYGVSSVKLLFIITDLSTSYGPFSGAEVLKPVSVKIEYTGSLKK